MEYVVSSNSIDVIKWLHANRTVSRSLSAMDYDVTRNKFKIM